MLNRNTPQAVRGIQKAMRRFRSEVARELGIPASKLEFPDNVHFAEPVITGELSKRMVELANQQIR